MNSFSHCDLVNAVCVCVVASLYVTTKPHYVTPHREDLSHAGLRYRRAI